MATAPVGDDQFGEDPSVNALQDRAAVLTRATGSDGAALSLLGRDGRYWTSDGDGVADDLLAKFSGGISVELINVTHLAAGD